MIGSLKYDELVSISSQLLASSEKIRNIVTKYGEDLNEIVDFCNTIDIYSKFINTNVELYKSSDKALKTIIEKNK